MLNAVARFGGALLLGGVLLAGCEDNAGLPRDPLPFVRFPVSLGADSTGQFLLVAGANFDRSYRAGVVRTVDTATDLYSPGTSTEIPGFAGAMALLPTAIGAQASHAIVPAREDDSITLLDLGNATPPPVTCGTVDADGRCDSAHHIGSLTGTVTVGDDPVDVALERLDAQHFRAHVVATTDGRISIFDVDASVTPPKLVVADALILGAGLTSVVVSSLNGHIYVSDMRASQVHVYHMEPRADPTAPWHAVLDSAISMPGSALLDYGRDLALSSDGGTLYVAWRSPNALLTVDISPGDDGLPRNKVIDMLPLGAGPAQLAVAPTGPNGRDLVYVSCYNTDSVWVIDPQRRGYEAIVPLPHAPYAVSTVHTAQGWKLYVALFNLHKIGVVPLEAGAAGRHTLAHFVEVAP
jgi:hypothetical protein